MYKSSVEIIFVECKGPVPWPSLNQVRPELVRVLKAMAKKVSFVDPLSPDFSSDSLKFSANKVLVFLPGAASDLTLSWMVKRFKNPFDRSRALFFFSGEGAKLGYTIWNYRKIFRPEDEWIVASEPEAILLNQFFPGSRKVSIVRYPIAPSFRKLISKRQKEKLRVRVGLDRRAKYALYAGRLSYQKNILSLFEFLSKWPDYNLILCGDVDQFGTPHIKSTPIHMGQEISLAIARLAMSERVIFKPFLSQAELRKMMQACDLQLSFSSHYGEEFGYSLAQGLGCGLKTVISDWGGHKNWKKFGNAHGGISYVPLVWSNVRNIGVPDLSQLKALPKNSPTGFGEWLETEAALGLRGILNRLDFSDRPLEVRVSPLIEKFWKQTRMEKRPYMYLSNKDRLYKIVVRTYLE